MNIRKKIGTFLFPDILRALRVSLRYALGGGAMRKLPAFPDPVFKRPVVDAEKCVGCKLCARICPAKAIRVRTFKDTTEVFFHLSEEKCASCGLCVESCPENALVLKGRENVRR